MTTIPRASPPGPLRKPRPPAARLQGVVYNDAPQIDRVVFIAGLHRSGTTLLERLLVSRYDLSCLRASVGESEGQHMQTVYPVARRYGGPGRFALSQQMRDDLDRLADHESCRRRILADWARFTVGDSPVLVEKSPPNLTKIHWLRRVFPGSRFVIMLRDPRAVAAATCKWVDAPLAELMLHWEAAYGQAMAAYRDADCTVIRYEDLVAEPQRQLDRLAAGLHLRPRKTPADLPDRHSEMRNSNADYIREHGGMRYGDGIWNRFGYDP